MTNRERVLASLEHRQPDRTPYHISFTHKARQAMIAHTGSETFLPEAGNCFEMFSAAPGGWREVAPGIWEDAYGVQWDRTVDRDIGVVCNCRITPETLHDYAFPALPESLAAHYARRDPDKFRVADLGFSLFERAWTLAGMENILAGMAEDAPFVHQLLDRILEFNLEIIDRACACDIDAMLFGDDWGQQTGLIMGPARWRDFIRPRIQEMYARVKVHGKFVMIHSCGKVDDIFPDLIALGLDIFNPFQPEVIDVADAKRRYGDRLTFWGGISTQRTLPYATPAQVRDEVKRLLEVVGKDGGYVAAPAHAIPGDAKPENVLAMLDALEHQS